MIIDIIRIIDIVVDATHDNDFHTIIIGTGLGQKVLEVDDRRLKEGGVTIVLRCLRR